MIENDAFKVCLVSYRHDGAERNLEMPARSSGWRSRGAARSAADWAPEFSPESDTPKPTRFAAVARPLKRPENYRFQPIHGLCTARFAKTSVRTPAAAPPPCRRASP